jgi:hypothetical protein
VKGEAAALWVRAQHCQSHYFSATLHTLPVLFIFILYAFWDIFLLKSLQKILLLQVNNL